MFSSSSALSAGGACDVINSVVAKLQTQHPDEFNHTFSLRCISNFPRIWTKCIELMVVLFLLIYSQFMLQQHVVPLGINELLFRVRQTKYKQWCKRQKGVRADKALSTTQYNECKGFVFLCLPKSNTPTSEDQVAMILSFNILYIKNRISFSAKSYCQQPEGS